MLSGGNPLTVGVGIIIEVIRKNNSDYDPDVGTEPNAIPSSRDPIYLGTLLRLFADNVPNFIRLIMTGPSPKRAMASTFGETLEPLGFDRFKTCELMAELLHCSNMGLLNEVGAEQIIATRDAERQRLREDGKLNPLQRDHSYDDLEMRGAHHVPEESRLQITNADEDGFEQVEPSREMSEDTSHEFVKTEVIPQVLPADATAKEDYDEFVDEPLSSPRLAVTADKVNEQQFDEADLVVAPLSPSKPKDVELEPSSQAPKSASTGDASNSAAAVKATTLLETTFKDDGSNSPIGPTFSLDLPPSSKTQDQAKGFADADVLKEAELAPRPEDMPAPLFAAPAAVESGAQLQPAAKPPVASVPQAQASVETLVDDSAQLQADDSIGPSASQLQTNETGQRSPVVGDFLKMQFVEHHVVPTILVCPPHPLFLLQSTEKLITMAVILLLISLEQLSS